MEYSHTYKVVVPQMVKQLTAFICPKGSLPHSQAPGSCHM